MSGYTIVEHKITNLYRNDGFRVSDNKMDIADFIRELNEDPFPFNVGDEVTVEGLDKLLFEAGNQMNETAENIRHVFSIKASDVDNQRMTINILTLGKLQYGAYLTVRYTQKDIPLNKIFDRVTQHNDSKGNIFYTTNANLTG